MGSVKSSLRDRSGSSGEPLFPIEHNDSTAASISGRSFSGSGAEIGLAATEAADAFAALATQNAPEATSAEEDSVEFASGSRSPSTSVLSSRSQAEGKWVYLKAKTRSHNSSRIVRKTMWFHASKGNTLTIGRNPECGLQLDDDRVSEINARVYLLSGSENNHVCLRPESRVYRLVGMGMRRAPATTLRVGSVIKVGSVSLQVTGLCTDTHDDFFQRFQHELQCSPVASSKKASPTEKVVCEVENDVVDAPVVAPLVASSSCSGEVVEELLPSGLQSPSFSRRTLTSTAWSAEKGDNEGRVSGRNDPSSLGVMFEPNRGAESNCDAEKTSSNDHKMCYICWTEEEGSDDEGCGCMGDRAGIISCNPLIRNPCGKCTGSSEWVHLQCLLKWIKSSGSGHCSICNGALPSHFSCAPPNIELKVVRHRRGQPWVGTRRFRISFADRNDAIIGRDEGVSVRLPDRSVCGVHARIKYDRSAKVFELSDCASFSGTFVQVREAFSVMSGAGEPTTYLKIGRTILSIKVSSQRRNGSLLLRMLPSFKRPSIVR